MNPIGWLIVQCIKTFHRLGLINKQKASSYYQSKEYFQNGQYSRGRLIYKIFPRIDPTFCLDEIFLDLGCGLAGKTLYLANEYGCKAIGLDCDLDLLFSARKILKELDNNRYVSLVCASADALPFKNASISKVISIDGFEHFSKPREVLIETWRCLNYKNGSAWFIFNPYFSARGAHSWPPIPFPWINTFFSDSLISEITAFLEGHSPFSYLELRQLNEMSLEKCGFLLTQIKYPIQMYTISFFERVKFIGQYLKWFEKINWIKERTTWVVILNIVR